MKSQVGNYTLTHRTELADGRITDVWYAKDYGTALRTKRGWWAGNGVVGLICDQGDEPQFCEPHVGPHKTHVEAIQSYDAALAEWLRR